MGREACWRKDEHLELVTASGFRPGFFLRPVWLNQCSGQQGHRVYYFILRTSCFYVHIWCFIIFYIQFHIVHTFDWLGQALELGCHDHLLSANRSPNSFLSCQGHLPANSSVQCSEASWVVRATCLLTAECSEASRVAKATCLLTAVFSVFRSFLSCQGHLPANSSVQ